MITVDACPRCRGAVVDYSAPFVESPLCINCGWRRPEAFQDVLAHLRAQIEKARASGQFAGGRPANGRTPHGRRSSEVARRQRARKKTSDEVNTSGSAHTGSGKRSQSVAVGGASLTTAV